MIVGTAKRNYGYADDSQRLLMKKVNMTENNRNHRSQYKPIVSRSQIKQRHTHKSKNTISKEMGLVAKKPVQNKTQTSRLSYRD